MSLDVSLTLDEPVRKTGTGVFIRENGQQRELSPQEVKQRYSNETPYYHYTNRPTTEVYSRNITHNLNKMAEKAGIYKACWRPEEIGIERAEQLIKPLEDGLSKLLGRPDEFTPLNPPNGWGTYEGLVEFVQSYLAACRQYPKAKVSACR